MFNRAKKELFLTEVKTIYKEVSKKYISENMKGNKIDSVSNSKNKLDIESNNMTYEIGLDEKGNIKDTLISNGEFCVATSKKYSEITIDDIKTDCTYKGLNNIAGTLKRDFFEVSGMRDRSLVYTLSFYSDNRTIDDADVYDVSEEEDNSLKMYVKPNSNNSSYYDLIIVGNGKIAFPENSSSLLSFNYTPSCSSQYYSNIKEINFNNSIDTKNVKDMAYLFFGSKLESIDLSDFDTRNVTDMSGMFSRSGILEVDLSNLNTSKVTNMSSMFYLSPINSIDVSGFDTRNVTNMRSMFSSTDATSIKGLNTFNTSKVTDMSQMFSGSDAKILDLKEFKTNNVKSMEYMFSSTAPTTINISSFNTENVTNMQGMFTGINVDKLDISNFNTSKVTNMGSMFSYSNINVLDLNNLDTSNVSDMSSMFERSTIPTLDLSSWDTKNVRKMNRMFSYSNINELDLSNFDTTQVTKMDSMFNGVPIETLDLSSFDTKNVTSMYAMFANSSKLKKIYVSTKFTTSKVTTSEYMFSSCPNLVGHKGTTYNSSKIDKTYARIDGGTSSPGYFSLRK